MAAIPLVKSFTVTGVDLFVVVLSPNCPSTLYPQHFTLPELVRAQVWLNPVVMAVTSLVSPLTSTGVLRSVVVPSPNWP
jgi:hypothetical protein